MHKLNVFLLLGQSNMSGRGDLGEVQPLTHPDVYMWRNGEWIAAAEPLHTDKPKMVGVGLGIRYISMPPPCANSASATQRRLNLWSAVLSLLAVLSAIARSGKRGAGSGRRDVGLRLE